VDLLACDIGNSHPVIIENKLALPDHDHLGTELQRQRRPRSRSLARPARLPPSL
jgi:hypothetical protein